MITQKRHSPRFIKIMMSIMIIATLSILISILIFKASNNLEPESETQANLPDASTEMSDPNKSNDASKSADDFLEKVRKATGKEAQKRQRKRKMLQHVMFVRNPSGSPQRHGPATGAGVLLNEILKRGTPPTEKERDYLFELHQKETFPGFALSYTGALGDQDLWRKANDDERKLIREFEERSDLLGEIESSIGWQDQVEEMYRVFNFEGTKEEKFEMMKEIIGSPDEPKVKDQNMSRRERDLAIAEEMHGSREAAELALNVRDLKYEPDAEKLQTLANYFQTQLTEAQATLHKGYENHPDQWWRDKKEWEVWWQKRIDWIDESARKLKLSLDDDDDNWAEAAANYHRTLVDEKIDLARDLQSTPPPNNLADIEKSRQFQQNYFANNRKHSREEFDKIIDDLFPQTSAP